MAGSALLWRRGHYAFGNADESAAANSNNLGNDILQRADQRQAQIQSNAHSRDDNVHVDEENALLNPKKKRRPPYDVPNFLLKENGLDFIYEHFPKKKFKGKGHEISDLKKLIGNYQEWAFIMYPSMNFKDIVKKTQTFSSKSQIKSHLQRLRDKRDGYDIIEEQEEEDEDIDLAMNNNGNDSNQNVDGNHSNNINRFAMPMSQNNNINQNGNNQMNNNQGMNRFAMNRDNNMNVNNINNSHNNLGGSQSRLQRQTDNNFDAVVEARANRANDEVNNNQNNNDNMDFEWGDPFDLMDMAPNDHDIEIANLMYG